VVFAITLFGGASVFSEGTSNLPSGSNMSSSYDCTNINIEYEPDDRLTRQETVSSMDDSFFDSLSKFDDCQISQPGSPASAQGAQGGSGDSGSGDSGDSGSAGVDGVASPNLSGTDAPVTTDAPDASASAGVDASGSVQANITGKNPPRVTQPGSGKIPDDIPSADNDSVLEAQIRQAAISETDPGTKKKLWDEYRKYKGLSRSGE